MAEKARTKRRPSARRLAGDEPRRYWTAFPEAQLRCAGRCGSTYGAAEGDEMHEDGETRCPSCSATAFYAVPETGKVAERMGLPPEVGDPLFVPVLHALLIHRAALGLSDGELVLIQELMMRGAGGRVPAWVSVPELARSMGRAHVPTLRARLARLEGRGLIQVKRGWTLRTGADAANAYALPGLHRTLALILRNDAARRDPRDGLAELLAALAVEAAGRAAEDAVEAQAAAAEARAAARERRGEGSRNRPPTRA